MTAGVVAALPRATAARLTGTTFFPHLIAAPFKHGLAIAFGASLLMCLIAAAASWRAGGGRAPSEADRPGHAPARPRPLPAPTARSGEISRP